MKRIKNPDQLPDWFDLSNYRGSSSLGLPEWWRLLRFRASMYHVLETFRRFHRNLGARSKESLEQSFRDPLHVGEPMILDKAREAYLGQYWPQAAMPWQREDAIRTTLAIDTALRDKGDIEQHDDWYYPPHKLILKIDPHASNEQILRNVRDYLAQFRKRKDIQGMEAEITQKTISNWNYYRVLPYLDLTLWSMLKGVRFTQILLGTAIASDLSTNHYDRLRKETIPRANDILCGPVLSVLEHQVMEMESRRNQE